MEWPILVLVIVPYRFEDLNFRTRAKSKKKLKSPEKNKVPNICDVFLIHILQVRYSITLELRPHTDAEGIGFSLPKDQIRPASEEVFAWFKAAVRHLAKKLNVRVKQKS